MNDPTETPLTLEPLAALARAATAAGTCPRCAVLVCPGWEAMPGGVDRAILERVGSLRDPADPDPTVAEFHPHGTNAWSADAPIAPAFFPYNRCDAWRCTTCARAFLRYTEYGGYYTEERIRALDERLLSDARPAD